LECETPVNNKNLFKGAKIGNNLNIARVYGNNVWVGGCWFKLYVLFQRIP